MRHRYVADRRGSGDGSRNRAVRRAAIGRVLTCDTPHRGASIEAPGEQQQIACLLYTSPSPRDGLLSRMPSSA